jgi:hypothetical protein
MNPHDERELEAVIDRKLKALPTLRAPETLVSRVLATIEQRAALPWYRQAWQAWPLPWQAVSMLVLLAAFGGVCFASWQFVHTPAFASASQEAAHWFSFLGTTWKAFNVLLSAVTMAFKSLGSAVVMGSLVALVLGYAMCVAFGTVYVRLAFARR